MSYRDDRDADQARIAALEQELATAQAAIARLEGRREHALVLASQKAIERAGGAGGTGGKLPWYGPPLRLELARTFDGAYPAEDFEVLIDRIRSISRDPGRAELLRASMTWSTAGSEKSVGPFMVVTVSIKDGKTTLVVSDRLSNLAGALYGGIGGGVGLGAIMVPMLPALIGAPLLLPVTIPAWLAGVFFGTRRLYKKLAKRRAEQLQQLFDALADEIAARLGRG